MQLSSSFPRTVRICWVIIIIKEGSAIIDEKGNNWNFISFLLISAVIKRIWLHNVVPVLCFFVVTWYFSVHLRGLHERESKEKKTHYPPHSLFKLNSFHLSHCSPNEECSFCLGVHLAKTGDYCHAAEKDLNVGRLERSIIITPKQSEEDHVFSPDFLFTPFHFMHGNSLKERIKGDRMKRGLPFSCHD